MRRLPWIVLGVLVLGLLWGKRHHPDTIGTAPIPNAQERAR
jgi:hypothetical protein